MPNCGRKDGLGHAQNASVLILLDPAGNTAVVKEAGHSGNSHAARSEGDQCEDAAQDDFILVCDLDAPGYEKARHQSAAQRGHY